MDFPDGAVVKNLLADAGDVDLIPGLGKSPGEGHGNTLQHSSLVNAIDGEAWWSTVCITKSRTQLNTHAHSWQYSWITLAANSFFFLICAGMCIFPLTFVRFSSFSLSTGDSLI